MHIDRPAAPQYPQLKALWQEAFGDPESFIEGFFATAFSPDRCLCITENGAVAAALYWLDCRWEEKKCAYLYAVATAKSFRGRGCCKALMSRAHGLLREQGYAGALLVPGEPGLSSMYGKMGYKPLCCMDTLTCRAQGAVPLTRADPREYAAARKALLPPGGVVQEMGLSFLAGFAELYTGNGFILAGTRQEDRFSAMELLGDAAAAPGILGALGLEQGTFRVPGNGPFAMLYPLAPGFAPAYFGLAFD